MEQALVNKVLVMLLVASILNVLRHLYFLISLMVRNEQVEVGERERFVINDGSLLILTASISYIFSVMLTSLKI